MLGPVGVSEMLRLGVISEDEAWSELQRSGWSESLVLEFMSEQRPRRPEPDVGDDPVDPLEDHVLVW